MTSRLNGRYLAERRETARSEVLGSTEICECSIRKTVRNDKQGKFTEMRSCDLSKLLFIHESILKTFIFNGGRREKDFLRAMRNALRIQIHCQRDDRFVHPAAAK